MGAWIETQVSCLNRRDQTVAPFVGAWIETPGCIYDDLPGIVAPFVGAWIETPDAAARSSMPGSLPSWERGLKPLILKGLQPLLSSLPSWERGLKLNVFIALHHDVLVAPFVGAWIETAGIPSR